MTQRREFMAISGGVNQLVVELSRKFRAVENRYNARDAPGDSPCAFLLLLFAIAALGFTFGPPTSRTSS